VLCCPLWVDFTLDLPEKLVAEVTFHHVKNNSHHPEYWDDGATLAVINTGNRDSPSGRQVDGRRMPFEALAEMALDWMAVAEERQTNVWDWLCSNIPTRWLFTREQVRYLARVLYLLCNPAVELGPFETCAWHIGLCGCHHVTVPADMQVFVSSILQKVYPENSEDSY
jgi:hypothetical protein